MCCQVQGIITANDGLVFWCMSCLFVVVLQAGSVVQQSLSQIRTVAAYNGEEAAHNQYNSKLDTPQKVGVALEDAQFAGKSACVCEAAAVAACCMCYIAVRTGLRLQDKLQPLQGVCYHSSNCSTRHAAVQQADLAVRQAGLYGVKHWRCCAALLLLLLLLLSGWQPAGCGWRPGAWWHAVCDVWLLRYCAVLW